LSSCQHGTPFIVGQDSSAPGPADPDRPFGRAAPRPPSAPTERSRFFSRRPFFTVETRLGLDHEKLTYRYSGRDFRLTDLAGVVPKGVVA
jgi:hypothetical protein